MKKFFEEYGFIILTCVVVIALVGITVGVKPLMADSLSDITNTWGLKAQELVKNSWDNIINNNQSDETGTVESGLLPISSISTELIDYAYIVDGSDPGVDYYKYINYDEVKIVVDNGDGTFSNNDQLTNALDEDMCCSGRLVLKTVMIEGKEKLPDYSNNAIDRLKSTVYFSILDDADTASYRYFMFDETNSNYVFHDINVKYFSYTKENNNLTNLTLYLTPQRDLASSIDFSNLASYSPDIIAMVTGNINGNSISGLEATTIEVSLNGVNFNTNTVKVGQNVTSWFSTDECNFYEGDFNLFYEYLPFGAEITSVKGNKVTISISETPGLDGEACEGYLYVCIPGECVSLGEKTYDDYLKDYFLENYECENTYVYTVYADPEFSPGRYTFTVE